MTRDDVIATLDELAAQIGSTIHDDADRPADQLDRLAALAELHDL